MERGSLIYHAIDNNPNDTRKKNNISTIKWRARKQDISELFMALSLFFYITSGKSFK